VARGAIACVNIVYGALSAAQTDLKYVIAYSSVSHNGRGHAGHGDPDGDRSQRLRLQMFAHGIMTGLFFASSASSTRKPFGGDLLHGRLWPDDAGHRHGLHGGGLSSLGLPPRPASWPSS